MNEEVKNRINHMLPPELEEAKKLIDLLIATKPCKRVTNLEYLERTITICCPVNETHHIKKMDIKTIHKEYGVMIVKKVIL